MERIGDMDLLRTKREGEELETTFKFLNRLGNDDTDQVLERGRRSTKEQKKKLSKSSSL